jgi:alpha/beta superfamily hydrolase
MDNPVVVRAAEVAGALGVATVRFNFRGVGGSTGTHGGGAAERRDLAAALAHLGAQLPSGSTLFAGGYSFGAMVAADVAADDGVGGLALIAPPLGLGDYRRLPDLPARLPLFIAVGSADEYCPAPAIDRLRAERPHAEVIVIEGANHFFFGKLFPLGEKFGGWLRARVNALGARQAGGRGGAG